MVIVGVVILASAYALLFSGSSYAYSKKNVSKTHDNPNSPIAGKTIVFLGSSVTYGFAGFGTSFVDYLAAIDHAVCIKEAVSGTTLTDIGPKSYIKRLQAKLHSVSKVDYFVCQLSTNDASFGSPIGKISSSYKKDDFDTKTVIGAMEYIIAYARDRWNCPVAFYTNPKYKSQRYEMLVHALLEVQKKWNIGIIDIWNNQSATESFAEHGDYRLADPIHPSRAGYLNVYVPLFEKYLYAHIGEKQAIPLANE